MIVFVVGEMGHHDFVVEDSGVDGLSDLEEESISGQVDQSAGQVGLVTHWPRFLA